MGGGGGHRSLKVSHPELLQQPISSAPVDTDPGHSLAHRAACFVPDPRTAGVDARTLGPDAHRSVHGARARTRRGARVVNLSDAVHETVVVDAPLSPVVPELVVQVAFGGVLRRHRVLRGAPRTARQQRQRQRQHQDQGDGEAADRAVPVPHGELVTCTDTMRVLCPPRCAPAACSPAVRGAGG